MSKKPGPNTPQGRLISSRNSAKHYMTSVQILVKDESEADLQTHFAAWHHKYSSDEPTFRGAVTQAARSAWLLERAQRGYDITMQTLYLVPQEKWTEPDHAEFQRSNRYLTAAKRTLDRDRNVLLQLLREDRAQDRADRDQKKSTQEEQVPVQDNNNIKTAPRGVTPMDQIIEVSVVDGKTITIIQPPNALLVSDIKRLSPSPGVHRTLRFIDNHVPPEYAWLGPPAPGKIHVTRFTPQQFLLLAESEKDGIIRPCDHLLTETPCQPKKSN